ncbi:MAG: O-antigen polysaccharide polymerase Wzy [Treponema sp.]|nr:O-antigen polysaccharide polymerase Wzy [Treponema sp.]
MWFYISLSPVLFFAGLLSYAVTSNLFGMLLGFSIFYIFTLIYSIKQTGFTSLYSIYLYTSAFFIYNSLFLSLFPNFTKKYFLKITYPWPYQIEEWVGFIFIICCFLMVFCGHLSYFSFRRKFNPILVSYRKKNWEWIGIRFFFVSLIPVCYKIYLQLQFVRTNGYFSIYSEGFESIKYPIWCSGAFLFFNASFFLLLASNPKRRKMLFYFFIYFIVTVFNSLKGGRGPLIAFIVVLIFLLRNKYDYSIKFKNLLFVLFLIVFLTSVLGSIRDSYGNSSHKTKGISLDAKTLIINTLWSQTSSRTVPLLIIRGNLKYHPYPFIFYPFTNRVLSHIYKAKGNEFESLKNYNNPSQVLMGNISVSSALSGMGYGSAIIGEAYECGRYFGVVVFSILASCLIAFLDKSKLKMKNFYIPFWYVVLTTVPGIPRKEIFQFVLYNLNDVVFFYIFFFIINFLFFRITLRNEK